MQGLLVGKTKQLENAVSEYSNKGEEGCVTTYNS